MSTIHALQGDQYPTITDSGIYPPPESGPYAYNAEFRPALGGEYRDPVFGKMIRRLTDIGANPAGEQLYSFHYVNCDGTLCFQCTNTGVFKIINVSDGSDAYTGVPVGLSISEVRWSMTDPDKYYYFSGASLMRRNLAAGTNTTIKTFAATLQGMGGSANYSDKTGRYFVVKYSDLNYLWDSQTDTIYANPVTPLDATGWTTISPGGNHIVVAGGTTPEPQQEHYAYAINHGTQTVAATPVQFWGMGGDHAAVISCSDGKDYAICFEAYDIGAIYRCDVTVDVAGLTPSQQRAAQTQLVDIDWLDTGGHFSVVSKGAYSDWVVVSLYAYSDATSNFNAALSSWRAFRDEIFAINVVTGALKRFAHHRTRDVDTAGYYCSPRASVSADGSVIAYASNYNDSTPSGYSDMYAILNPFA